MEEGDLEIKELFIPQGQQSEIVDNPEKDFIDVLKMFAPGTSLRTALDDLLRARMGALIVFDNGYLGTIVERGFKINCKFSSQKLVELCKMDGAIILSRNGKKILSANALLMPSGNISTKETGTRHKSAERTSKQAKTIVIAVSERKNKISIYYGDINYRLESTSEIFRKATETLQILEKQKELFNELLDNLNVLELRRIATTNDVCLVLQRGEIIKRISEIVRRYLVELGKEGSIISIRMKELMSNVYKEQEMILKDYFGQEFSSSLELLEKMNFEFLIEPLSVIRVLFDEVHHKTIYPKGYRILSKTNLLEHYVESLISHFGSLDKVLVSKDKELLEVLESEEIISFFREEIYNLKEKLSIGRRI